MSRGQIARWMLEEVAVDYDEHILAYGPTGMAADDYRRINPMAKVPAIAHGEKIVTEAAAIGLYLADVFQDRRLGPMDDERAAYYRWVLFCAGPLEQAVTSRAMGWEVPDDPQKQGMLGFGNFERTIDALEDHLSGRHYVCGDRFTMADCYVGSHVDWGLSFGTIPERAAFKTYIERIREREAYKNAKARDQALIEQMKTGE
ncbi:glutathione S-transferase family protein [Notoacmeibacter sp. MSK16QG-6]|uniref:glutathione S-transferase family protein n=1 Tax=Notoacmeibacter sp. MSK16QG-6 TaxID=2957982 RepID=UPI0020A08A4F|nr:glutathione S-transferase family protein [Notoacmeibacter sp. MSK16QG-6]MCP1198160.1 glutathione S-transferase family protein [Notoacmeibacter sp. MSK16QG-6]